MLSSRTRPEWVDAALSDLDALLSDHAHCEKKAAASALALIAGYPEKDELVRRMGALAIEEMQHFRSVHERLRARGLSLGRDRGDPYAQRLFRLARSDRGRLTDRLLILGLIEARSHERLALLGQHVPDADLASFYRKLAEAEERHAESFVELARLYDDPSEVSRRLLALSLAEAEIVASLPLEPRVH
jgi:tRNA-(ms[2]io[6]A)-hydroxylase